MLNEADYANGAEPDNESPADESQHEAILMPQTAAALQQPQPISTQLPTNQQAWQQFASTLNQWLQYLAAQSTGYNPTFQSGYLMSGQANGQIGGNINFEVGLNIPNPSGSNGPALLLGSGPTPVTFAILQDQAYTPAEAGNNLILTAGETQGSGTANGGYLLGIGGGSFGGTGGTATWQGGTSANGTGGQAILAGGNATNGGIPGDAFVIGGAGQSPGQGANVHLILTTVNGISGVIRFRNNSTILMDVHGDGSIFLYNGGGGFGTAGQKLTSQGPGMPLIWS